MSDFPLVFARYSPVPGCPGSVQVVAMSGEILAPSFFDLRASFAFVFAFAWGGWVALAPRVALPAQPALFQEI